MFKKKLIIYMITLSFFLIIVIQLMKNRSSLKKENKSEDSFKKV